ncbi:hypothetical protein GmHk_13G037753 [Glycine max]|nr:hypothetical protein GmHk_13G037753 [Glycine max]
MSFTNELQQRNGTINRNYETVVQKIVMLWMKNHINAVRKLYENATACYMLDHRLSQQVQLLQQGTY